MTTATEAAPALTTAALMSMSRAELETLYKTLAPGPIPDGESYGLASAAPGTPAGRASQAFFGLCWQGKVFDRAAGRLLNKILGVARAVPAKVFVGESWFDGRPAVIIDYKGVSLLCRPVRDEIRLAAPDVYLGFAYLRLPGGPKAPLLFALDFARRGA